VWSARTSRANLEADDQSVMIRNPVKAKPPRDTSQKPVRPKPLTSCRFLSLSDILPNTPGSTKLPHVLPISPPPAIASGADPDSSILIGPEIVALLSPFDSPGPVCIIREKKPDSLPPGGPVSCREVDVGLASVDSSFLGSVADTGKAGATGAGEMAVTESTEGTDVAAGTEELARNCSYLA